MCISRILGHLFCVRRGALWCGKKGGEVVLVCSRQGGEVVLKSSMQGGEGVPGYSKKGGDGVCGALCIIERRELLPVLYSQWRPVV